MAKAKSLSTFRQLEQRHVSAEISLMEWNPMLDLIALATMNGEILLHRWSWQKVWSIPSCSTKEKAVHVTALSWRPDGKILAYAYDNGKITLCDVENSEAVHLLDVHCIVYSLAWVQCLFADTSEEMSFYKDWSEDFLPKHYSFNKGYGTTSKQSDEIAEDFKRMKGQKGLNILAIGMVMEIGVVQLHSFGMFPTGFVPVKINLDDPIHDRVISLTLSRDFRVLTVVIERQENENCSRYYYRSYSISMLNDYMEEIKVVSLKYGQISSLLTYLSSTIRAISEAWEDILLEVDTKLHNYAHQKEGLEEGSISDDFLELLMFGNPSESLEKFLLHDLTESGLKKFGHSVENSYSNIQKLVLKRLQNVSFSLFYHLNDFRGMVTWEERFGALGLEEKSIHEAVLAVGSFVLKAIEIQRVIDSSMKNFKAFFRWLYSAILRLSDEPIPLEISKLTQQDLHFVAEFLKENFALEYDENKKTTVKLERVAQYLKKEDLSHPIVMSGNPWVKFLKENPSMMDTGLIFPNYPEKSLVTLYADLRKIIDTAVQGPWAVLEKKASLSSHLSLKISKGPPKISHVYCNDTKCLFTVITCSSPPCPHFYIIKENSSEDAPIEAIGIAFNNLNFLPSSSAASDSVRKHCILDLQFYSTETLTVLLMEDFDEANNFPVLLQVPIKSLCSEMKKIDRVQGQQPVELDVPVIDGSSFIDKNNYKRLENMKAAQVAVSGSRKVVCVLFASRRQVRLFEMDAEEEEEDEEADDSVLKDTSKGSLFSDEDMDADKSGEIDIMT